MKQKLSFLHKTINIVASLLFLMQSFAPYIAVQAVYAQEITPTDTPTPSPTDTTTPTPTDTISPTDAPTPTDSVTPTDTTTPTPTDTISPTPDQSNPTVSPTDSVTPTDSITPTDTTTPTATLTPDDTTTPTQSSSDNSSSQGPPATTVTVTPSVTPSPTPTPDVANGSLDTTILKNVSAPSLDLGSSQVNSATLSTDKSDYAPTDTALISGANFEPNTTYSLTISSTDAPATSTTVNVTTDSNGSFTYAYQLDGNYRPNYKVVVTDDTGAVVATTTFTDSPPSASLDQYANNAPAGWQNGNLNTNQATYREGDSVPYRLTFSNLASGTSYSVTIGWQISNTNGILTAHAIDYLTTYNRTVSSADPCSGVSGCSNFNTNANQFTIPADPTLTSGCGFLGSQIAGKFMLLGGNSLTTGSGYSFTSCPSGTQSNSITLTFTATSANAVLAWGGHIGSQVDWGIGNSASSISGSPYHMSLNACTNINGCGGQDRSLKAGSVLPVPGLSTQVSSSSIIIGQSVTDTATYSEVGSNGVVSGTTQFYECSGNAACTSTANPVGTAVANSADHATSPSFTPNSVGTYCFAAYYTPDANAQYSPIDSTVTTNECVTVTNPPTGTIELKKVWSGVAGQTTLNIGTTAGASDTASVQTGANGTAPLTTGTKTVNTGTYYVSETGGLTNYTSALACTDNSTPVTPGTNNSVAVAQGHTVICTFTNTRNTGDLKAVKVVDDGTPLTNWSFSLDGGTPISANVGGQVDFGQVTTGVTHTIAESGPSGYHLVSITGTNCTNSSGTANATVSTGGTTTCTFTNNINRGTMIVKKVMVGGVDTFTFTGSPSGTISTNNGTITVNNVLPGTYTTTESTKSGWVLSSVSCDDGSSTTPSTTNLGNKTATFNVDPGETVTCTFTNSKLPTLTVNKILSPSNDSGLFNLQIDGNTAGTGANVGNNGTTGAVVVGIGSHSASETAGTNTDLSNYTAVISGDCASDGTITLAAGDNKVCTITNTRNTGSIELKKHWVGTAGTTTLQIGTTAGGNQTATQLVSGTDGTTGPQTVNTGTYYVSEVGGLTNYNSGLVCTNGGNLVSVGQNNSVTVNKGDVVVCTFTNTRQTGTITVNKIVVDPFFTQGVFNLKIDGTTDATNVGDGGTTGQVAVDTGTHTVSETAGTNTDLSNYTAVISGDCDSNGSVTVAAGQNAVCTITNTRNSADLKVQKVVDDKSPLSNWAFNLDGANAISADNTTGIVDFGQVATNVNHTIAEGGANQSDYTLVSVTGTDCTSNNDGKSATANVANGTSGVICTFTNDRNTGTIKVKKVVVPSDSGTTSWDFAINGQGPDNTSTNSAQGLHDGDSSQVFTDYTGNYTVTESGTHLSDYTTTTSCTDGTNTETNVGATTQLFYVGPGNNVVCTFTNTIIPGSIQVIKYNDLSANGVYDQGTDPVLSGWTMNVSSYGAQLTDNTGTATFNNVLPGTYTLSENLQNGWNQSNISCEQEVGIDNDNSHPVTVAPNATTTCYVGNYQNAHVIVTKDVVAPDGSPVTDTSTQFGFSLGASTANLTDGQSHDFTVSPGAFSVTETPDANYDFGQCTSSDDQYNGALSVTDGYSSVVTSGETIHITCTNKQKKATINVHKVVVLSDGTTVTDDNHTFTAQLNASNDATFSQDSPTQYVVNPGSPFTISELTDPNYTSLGCKLDSGADATNFSLASNQTVTVTCTNKQNPGTISGHKFMADGISPIQNWGISLFSCDSNFLNCVLGATTTTDSNGFYSFSGLITGFYQVVEDLVSTYTPVSVTSHNVTVNPGTQSANNDFANFQNINITVCKVQDADGNPNTTNDQTKVFGWSMQLLVDGQASGAAQQTNEDLGCTVFSNLGPGHDYSVQEEVQDGWTALVGTSHDFGQPQDGVNQKYTFVNFPNGSITVHKQVDTLGTGDFSGDDATASALGFTWSLDGSGTNSFGSTVSSVSITTHTVNEDLNGQPYHFVGWYPTDSVDFSCQQPEGTTLPINVSLLNPGESQSITLCNQRDTGELIVDKLADTDGTGSYSSVNPSTFSWGTDPSTTTNVMGQSTQEVTGDYNIYENTVTGYKFTGWFYGSPEENDFSCTQPEFTSLPTHVTVYTNEPTEITLCNQIQIPVLTITKTNNQLGNNLNPGADVIYTLTVTATQSAADNVVLTDLLPKGFHYVDGSATIDTGNGSGPQPFNKFADDYHSPGIWDLGHIDLGQTLTLTMAANIDGGQTPGDYKDVAWAKGSVVADPSNIVVALSEPTDNPSDNGVVDTNFVGTNVNVVTNNTSGTSVNLVKQVLGASTVALPDTGANVSLTLLALCITLFGLIALIFGIILKKKNNYV